MEWVNEKLDQPTGGYGNVRFPCLVHVISSFITATNYGKARSYVILTSFLGMCQ